MKRQWTAQFNIKPVAKARARINRKGWAWTPKKTKDAENELRRRFAETLRFGNRPISQGPIAVSIECHTTRPKKSKREYPTVRPDIDNLVKLITDAGNGLLYLDDSQIVILNAKKLYGPQDKIVIEITEL